MPLTLSIVDNANGTGTATLAGSTPGTVNTLRVSAWPGTAFVDAGTRTGDGTLDISTIGPQWAYAYNAADVAISAVVAFRVTDGTLAVFDRVLTAVRDVIAGLSLAGVLAANVKRWKEPWAHHMAEPGISVTPGPEKLIPVETQRDDVDYPVIVAYAKAAGVASQDAYLSDGIPAVLLWREQIRRAFQFKPLSGVPEVYTCRVEPGQVFWPQGFSAQHDVGALTIRCIAREPRTVE